MGKGTISPLPPPLPRCLSVCLGLSDLTRGLPGLRSPFEGGNVSRGCLAVWLRRWDPAAWELHSASSARHWASLCPRSRRRLQQQIAVKSQRPSPAPQPSRISMRRTAAPSVVWVVPTGPEHLLCFTHSPGQRAAESWSRGWGHGWGTAVTMVIPRGFIPFCLSVCFSTKAG